MPIMSVRRLNPADKPRTFTTDTDVVAGIDHTGVTATSTAMLSHSLPPQTLPSWRVVYTTSLENLHLWTILSRLPVAMAIVSAHTV
jgi:hypothetical protein